MKASKVLQQPQQQMNQFPQEIHSSQQTAIISFLLNGMQTTIPCLINEK